MNDLGKHLRNLREGRYSVREFAQMIGKTPGYISRIEVRGEIPNATLLCEIASLLDVDPEVLLHLAKKEQIARTTRDVEAKHQSALALFRKGKKD